MSSEALEKFKIRLGVWPQRGNLTMTLEAANWEWGTLNELDDSRW